jgi:hypothetical protein
MRARLRVWIVAGSMRRGTNDWDSYMLYRISSNIIAEFRTIGRHKISTPDEKSTDAKSHSVKNENVVESAKSRRAVALLG